MPRLFFAFRPPDAILDAAEAEISRLKKSGADVRWLDRDHLHVTVRFLGAVEDRDVPGLVNLLEATCRGGHLVNLLAHGIDTFPRWPKTRGRVIWIGMGVGNELNWLRSALDEGARGMGLPSDERDRFTPHLTIGRVRSPRNFGALKELIGSGSRVLGEFRVEEILLIQSQLTPAGAVYTTLKRASLPR